MQALQWMSLCFGTDASAIDWPAFSQFVQENQSLIDQTFPLDRQTIELSTKNDSVFRQVFEKQVRFS